MLITINLDVIDREDGFRYLDRLLMLFEQSQHEWYIEDDVETIMDCGWPAQLSKNHQNILKEIIEKAYVRSANISKAEKRERGMFCITSDGENTLENSLPLLDDPLYILVENETSDSLFLRRLFEIFPKPGKLLKRALQKAYLTFYPAGGRNETIKTLTNIKNKKQAPYTPRVLVFIDSDKKYPGQLPEASLQAIIDHCREENITLHILYKRELENYIPGEVLRKRVPGALSNVLAELFNLNPNQWDFFDLEKGFNDHRPMSTDPLFSEFSDRANLKYNALRRGFQVNNDFLVKRELYKFVEDEEFNAVNVKSRCSHQPDRDELLNLLLLIKNKL